MVAHRTHEAQVPTRVPPTDLHGRKGHREGHRSGPSEVRRTRLAAHRRRCVDIADKDSRPGSANWRPRFADSRPGRDRRSIESHRRRWRSAESCLPPGRQSQRVPCLPASADKCSACRLAAATIAFDAATKRPIPSAEIEATGGSTPGRRSRCAGPLGGGRRTTYRGRRKANTLASNPLPATAPRAPARVCLFTSGPLAGRLTRPAQRTPGVGHSDLSVPSPARCHSSPTSRYMPCSVPAQHDPSGAWPG